MKGVLQVMSSVIAGISHFDVRELKSVLDDSANDSIVIDVREVEEYEAGHIPGIPLIPMGEIIDYLDQFDRNREYIFVCRSGRRSLEVAKFFKNNGFDKVHNYLGGMLQWDGELALGQENIITEFHPEQLERKRIE